MNRSLLIILLIVGHFTHVFARIDEPVNDKRGAKKEESVVNASDNSSKIKSARKQMVTPANMVLGQEALNALNGQLNGIQLNSNNAFVASAAFLADVKVSAAAVNMRDSANALFKKLEQTGYLDMDVNASPAMSPVKLPIGLKKHFGENNIVYVGFSRAVIKPTHAELTAFVKMEMYVEDGQTGSKKKRELFFGADGIKMTNNGKIIGDARLVLLGDYTIPMFNGKVKMILRGGEMSEANGGIVNGDRTFAILDCNGFREAGIMADAIFDPAVIKPIDANTGLPKSGNVEATMRVIGGVTDFSDILATLNFKSGFAVTGHEKWGFAVQNMFFDLSVKRNHSGIGYLNDYYTSHSDIIAGDLKEWKGMGLNSFKLFLPSEFKKSNTSRVAIEVNKLIIDKFGVSCDIGMNNISNYDLANGKTDSTNAWRMSLDNFYLTFDQSRLAGGKFGGKILLPTSKKESSAYGYNAIIDLKGSYELTLNSLKNIDFNIFGAEATLTPQSYISLALVPKSPGSKEMRFLPKAVLSGFMTLKNDGITNSAGNLVSGQNTSQQVTFQDLELTTVAPYIKLKSAGYSRQSSMANFPVTVESFNVSITNSGGVTQASLSGGMNMNLMGSGAGADSTAKDEEPAGFSAKSVFKVSGKLTISADGVHGWELVDMTMKPAGLNARISKYWFEGSLEPFNDPAGENGRGKGLTATIKFKKKEKGGNWELMGSFLGVFGNIQEENFRYWLVEGFANVLVMNLTAVDLRGIGGGVYHHLYPSEDAKPSSGIGRVLVRSDEILPGQKVTYRKSDSKLGFKAVVGLESTGKDFMKGMVGLEVIFNSTWGLSSIGLFGNATLAADFQPGFKTPAFANKLKDKFGKLSKKVVDSPVGSVLSKSKFIEKGKSEFNEDTVAKTGESGTIALNVALMLNLDENQLHGDGSVFVNSPVLNGMYAGGLAGRFVLHFDKKEWYVHAGNPSERIGIVMGMGPLRVKASTYLMVGQRIPPLPPPPPQILALLGPSYAAATPARDESAIATGSGFAFGADVNVNTGQMRATIFYAQFQAGAGLDVMLSKGNHACDGINGWYARGQAYAYVSGDIGITVKLGFIKKNVSIFNGAAGVLLQAGLPNPAWFRGNVVGRYSALGGLVKGNFNLKLALGNECGNSITYTPPNNAATDNYGGGPSGLVNNGSSVRIKAPVSNLLYSGEDPQMAAVATPIILSFTPAAYDSRTDYDYTVTPAVATVSNITESVFTVPTFTFSHSIGSGIRLYHNNPSGETYIFALGEVSLKLAASGVDVPFTRTWDELRTVMTIQPNSVLQPNTKYRVTVDIQLKREDLTNVVGGLNAKDRRVIEFQTGETEYRIPASNIAYMYPVDQQRFLYKGESSTGYIKLKRSQSYINTGLLTTNRKVKFVSEKDAYEVAWTMAGDSINFQIPNTLLNEQKYKFFVTGFKTATDSIVVYQGEFRTSKYNTVAEKWNSISNPVTKVYKNTSTGLTKNTVLLYANANMGEWFDETDLVGNNLTGFKPLVSAKNKLNEAYYTGAINPLVYSATFNGLNGALSTTAQRQAEVLVSSRYVHYARNLNQTDSLKKWMPYEYSATNLVHRDYLKLRDSVAVKYVKDNGFGSAVQDYKNKAELLLSQPIPYIENGNYSIDIYKNTPNRTASLSKNFVYNLSGITDDRGYTNGIASPPGDAMVVTKTFFNETIQSICAHPLNRLISNSKILQGAVIRMTAATEIILEAGFETFEDVDFVAEIAPCVN
jgi:hypothetical protein